MSGYHVRYIHTLSRYVKLSGIEMSWCMTCSRYSIPLVSYSPLWFSTLNYKINETRMNTATIWPLTLENQAAAEGTDQEINKGVGKEGLGGWSQIHVLCVQAVITKGRPKFIIIDWNEKGKNSFQVHGKQCTNQRLEVSKYVQSRSQTWAGGLRTRSLAILEAKPPHFSKVVYAPGLSTHFTDQLKNLIAVANTSTGDM